MLKVRLLVMYTRRLLSYTERAWGRSRREERAVVVVHPKLVATIESEEPTHRLAVLIDADNAQASVIENLLN